MFGGQSAQLPLLMYIASAQPAPGQTRTTIKFQASLQGTQIHKKCPQGNMRSELTIIRIQINVESLCFKHSPCERPCFKSRASKIRITINTKKVSWKQARKEIEISSLSVQQVSKKKNHKINPKSMKVLFWTPLCPS